MIASLHVCVAHSWWYIGNDQPTVTLTGAGVILHAVPHNLRDVRVLINQDLQGLCYPSTQLE